MKITIIETNERKELEIVNDHVDGLLSIILDNFAALPPYNYQTESYHLKQTDYDFFFTFASKLQVVEDRIRALRKEMKEHEYEAMQRDFFNKANELLEKQNIVDYPSQMKAICDKYDPVSNK